LIVLSHGASLIVSISNVTAIIAMIVVDVAAARVALGKSAGSGGIDLPGGIAIPVVAVLAAAVQLPSLGWVACLVSAVLMVAGMAIFVNRHRAEVEAEREAIARRVRELDTPLTRALRRLKRDPIASHNQR
jgi:hypothetical protein